MSTADKDVRSAKFQNFIDVCMMGGGGGEVRTHHQTNVFKISRLFGATTLLALDVSPLNFVNLLILRFLPSSVTGHFVTGLPCIPIIKEYNGGGEAALIQGRGCLIFWPRGRALIPGKGIIRA